MAISSTADSPIFAKFCTEMQNLRVIAVEYDNFQTLFQSYRKSRYLVNLHRNVTDAHDTIYCYGRRLIVSNYRGDTQYTLVLLVATTCKR